MDFMLNNEDICQILIHNIYHKDIANYHNKPVSKYEIIRLATLEEIKEANLPNTEPKITEPYPVIVKYKIDDITHTSIWYNPDINIMLNGVTLISDINKYKTYIVHNIKKDEFSKCKDNLKNFIVQCKNYKFNNTQKSNFEIVKRYWNNYKNLGLSKVFEIKNHTYIGDIKDKKLLELWNIYLKSVMLLRCSVISWTFLDIEC